MVPSAISDDVRHPQGRRHHRPLHRLAEGERGFVHHHPRHPGFGGHPGIDHLLLVHFSSMTRGFGTYV